MTTGGQPENVRNRSGKLVPFDSARIARAVYGAALEALHDAGRADAVAESVRADVLERLTQMPAGEPIPIEYIQDHVEAALMRQGHIEVARCYIIHREDRHRVRAAKSVMGLADDLKLPLNAMEVLRKRYLLRDEEQNVVETPGELFARVAKHVASAQHNYPSDVSEAQTRERFEQMMRHLEFLPNSPTLMNAGTPLGQLAACFVLPVEDSISGIFQSLSDMATIHQTGGGTGFAFSRLRPRGDIVATTKGQASGPVSFMEVFDKATSVIVQGGRRRGANMGILRCDHPDIVEFVQAKADGSAFSNFNLSVAVTDAFMEAAAAAGSFELVNPRTCKAVRSVSASFLFDLIAHAAWSTGDPGLIFIDEINRRNPLPALGNIEATNPCGELPLLPYESCNLGSVNLAKMVSGTQVDWERLRETIHWAVRFLDNVVDLNRYPLPNIKKATLTSRKIGLGVMGLADMLITMGTPYGSARASSFAETLMKFVRDESLAASHALAKVRSHFPHYPDSMLAQADMPLRNATVNTIAPTGTISMIAGCSSGIEPLFAVSFVRNVLSGSKLMEVNPAFERLARKQGFYSRDLMAEIARRGSISGIKAIPQDVRELFVTAFDLSPRQHLAIQAAFQKYTDNAVSKTINLPTSASVDDVKETYMTAHRLGCKGITVYRYGCKPEQVLSFGGPGAAGQSGPIVVDNDYAGGCFAGECSF
jgi:ribonucleoside-diphosphate reductase alpha chain